MNPTGGVLRIPLGQVGHCEVSGAGALKEEASPWALQGLAPLPEVQTWASGCSAAHGLENQVMCPCFWVESAAAVGLRPGPRGTRVTGGPKACRGLGSGPAPESGPRVRLQLALAKARCRACCLEGPLWRAASWWSWGSLPWQRGCTCGFSVLHLCLGPGFMGAPSTGPLAANLTTPHHGLCPMCIPSPDQSWWQ